YPPGGVPPINAKLSYDPQQQLTIATAIQAMMSRQDQMEQSFAQFQNTMAAMISGSTEVPNAPPAKSRPTSRPLTPRTASQVEAAIINAVNPTPGSESFADQLRKQMINMSLPPPLEKTFL
ncbi:unnamed protein product, partial [Prorocentrum cordatum]